MVPGGLTPTCTGPLCHVDRVCGSWPVPPLHTCLHPAEVTPGSSEFGPETLPQKSVGESVDRLQPTDARFQVLTSELHVRSGTKIRGRWNRRDAKRRDEKGREETRREERRFFREVQGPTQRPSVENQEHQPLDEETQRRHHNRETPQTHTDTHRWRTSSMKTPCSYSRHYQDAQVVTVTSTHTHTHIHQSERRRAISQIILSESISRL